MNPLKKESKRTGVSEQKLRIAFLIGNTLCEMMERLEQFSKTENIDKKEIDEVIKEWIEVLAIEKVFPNKQGTTNVALKVGNLFDKN